MVLPQNIELDHRLMGCGGPEIFLGMICVFLCYISGNYSWDINVIVDDLDSNML
jgi:hypothetical protein